MNPQSDPARRATPSGGVRSIIAMLALGVFLLLVGLVFLLPFALSPNAIQNDVYMTNLFVAPVLVVVGVALGLIGLAFLLRSAEAQQARGSGTWGRALLIALVGAGIVAVAFFLVGGRYDSYPPGEIYWPPYLNGLVLAVAFVMGVAVTVAGWLWAAREPGGAGLSERPA